jgi:hypothetical protein
VVAYITGNGLKTVEALGERVRPTATIAPRLEDFAELEADLAGRSGEHGGVR